MNRPMFNLAQAPGTNGRLAVMHKGLNSTAGGLNAFGSQPGPRDPSQFGQPSAAQNPMQGIIQRLLDQQGAAQPADVETSDQEMRIQALMKLIAGLGQNQ